MTEEKVIIMKKNISSIILVLVFFVGLSVMLYPSVSDYINSKHQSRAIAAYNEMLASMTEEDYTKIFNEAYEYNAKLFKTDRSFYAPDQVEGYWDSLNVSGTGIMGYITIDKIGVELPIYHGTGDEVLNVAVGHLYGTSLPVGGENTHCVLSAHRGLPSAKLFTNLDKLDEGDTFTITVLNKVLTYRIEQILVVVPSDVSALQTVAGKDYCTLLTCTPYGINSHRLLVRGTRIETAEEKRQLYVSADAFKIDPFIITPIVAVPMLLVLLAVLLIKYRPGTAVPPEKTEATDPTAEKSNKPKKPTVTKKAKKNRKTASEPGKNNPDTVQPDEKQADGNTPEENNEGADNDA